MYGGKQRYTGVTNTVLNDARVTPDSMRAVPYVAGDGVITNSFGGTVNIVATGAGGATDNLISVTYEKVPGAVCSKLIAGAGTGWDEIIISGFGAPVKNLGSADIDIARVASGCATDNGGGVIINFLAL